MYIIYSKIGVESTIKHIPEADIVEKKEPRLDLGTNKSEANCTYQHPPTHLLRV